jgi:hypothetical protein
LKRKKTAKKRAKPAPGQSLVGALTKDQMAALFDAVVDTVDVKTRDDILRKLDKDIAGTAAHILSGQADTSEPFCSDKKRQSDWDDLWGQWGQIASEVGDEEGRYVQQDHHWEAPYFCYDEFASDLDQVVRKMRPLMAAIVDDRDVFIKGLEEVDKEAADLPDWMDAGEMGEVFGPVTTQCWLKWEYQHTQLAGEEIGTLFVRILEASDDFQVFSPDWDEVLTFFLGLAKKERQSLYEYLQAARNTSLKQHFENKRSVGFNLYHALAEEFDRESYLSQCEALIGRHWAEGLPLLQQLVKDRNYQDAQLLLDKMLVAYLKYYQTKTWTPESSLFVSLHPWNLPEPDTKRLLQSWLKIARGLKQDQRIAALKIQLQTVKTPWHWDSVVQCFYQNAPSLAFDTFNILFNQWIQHNARGVTQTPPDDHWIGWLLQAGVDPKKGKTWFRRQLTVWLERVHEDRKTFLQQRDFLLLLTKDLKVKSQYGQRYPAFCSMVSREVTARENEKSRREWLKRMDAEKSLTRLIRCWQKHAEALLPDPQTSDSTYQEVADWMVVLKELNPRACHAVIQQWKVDHARRRNLWAALEACGLDG